MPVAFPSAALSGSQLAKGAIASDRNRIRSRAAPVCKSRSPSIFQAASLKSMLISHSLQDGAKTAGACVAAVALALAPALPAAAAKVSAPMENVSYSEVDCPSKTGFTCVRFTGDVTNKETKAINTADIYGRVYDKAQNGVTDNEENDRIGYVDVVPPGTSQVHCPSRPCC